MGFRPGASAYLDYSPKLASMVKIECAHCDKVHTTTQYIGIGMRGVLSLCKPKDPAAFYR